MSGRAAGTLAQAERLLEQRRIDDAWTAFKDAEQAGADPDRCAAGRWMAAMFSGQFEFAWQESDAIRQRKGSDPLRFWNGESIDGKRLIVRCLHGLGDSVQMLRYLPLLQERCSSVVVEVPPRLLPLASCFAGMGQVITWGENAPANPPVWDVQAEVMELPYLFRTTLQELPLARNYLSPPRALCEHTALSMAPKSAPRVGVVWSASDWDPTRCLPMDCLERMLTLADIEFWNLQGGKQHALGRQSAKVTNIRDAAELGDGLPLLVAVVANLDLVITVDTLAAHLAGAMGKPAWVLLQQRADWRWMHLHADSPWYPTLRLWRQPVHDDWQALTTQVCAELASWAKNRSHNVRS